MGFFSRSSTSTPKVPRWGFRTGWEDFIVIARTEARTYGLMIADEHFVDGVVPLPETAQYDGWDLRPVATRCRDLDPHEWAEVIRASLVEMYGRAGEIEVLDAPPPSSARVATPPPPKTPERIEERLRVQLFGADYFAPLAKDVIACRPFGDAWLAVVQDLGGGEATVKWSDLDAAGIDRDRAFTMGMVNGFNATGGDMQMHSVELPGATCELAVANGFYLSAVMLATHSQMPADAPIIACAMTWHHWVLVTLADDASRETLVALAALIEKLKDGVAVQRSEWIGTSLWWWPGGAAAPVPFTVDDLPTSLAQRLR